MSYMLVASKAKEMEIPKRKQEIMAGLDWVGVRLKPKARFGFGRERRNKK